MGLERDLEDWQAAGLITAEQAQAIRAHEGETRRPYATWAVIGVGLLALALGLVLVVAANWDRIPANIKLGVHFLVTAAAAFGVWDGVRRQRRWQTEGALFLFGALVLSGLALQGQVYQLIAPIWQLLAWWAVLMLPALLLLGQTRLLGKTLGLMLAWLALVFPMDDHGAWQQQAIGLSAAYPFLLLALSLPFRNRPAFQTSLRELGLGILLLGASLTHLVWATTVDQKAVHEALEILPIPLMAAAGLLVLLMRLPQSGERAVLTTASIAAFISGAMPLVTLHGEGWHWRFFGALIFAAMWGAVAQAAYAAGWRLLFGLCMGALAVRLFIIYFELFGSLAMTGMGLIVAGGLIIALALTWRRFMGWLPAPKGKA